MIWRILLAIALLGPAGYLLLDWENLIRKFSRKKIAVLGERATGKTTLQTFLRQGRIPKDYEQTLVPEKVQAGQLNLRDLELKFATGVDVAGSDAAYNTWKKAVMESDMVFYLFRYDRIKNEELATIERTRKDIRHIADWLNERNSGKPIPLVLIGTFCDKTDPAIQDCQDPAKYQDEFQKNEHVRSLICYAGSRERATAIAGSLVDERAAAQLVWLIFKQLSEVSD